MRICRNAFGGNREMILPFAAIHASWHNRITPLKDIRQHHLNYPTKKMLNPSVVPRVPRAPMDSADIIITLEAGYYDFPDIVCLNRAKYFIATPHNARPSPANAHITGGDITLSSYRSEDYLTYE